LSESQEAFRWRGLAPLGVILVAYGAAAAGLLPRTRWQLNPDGVSYIQISRRILAGDYHGAVSAHWSPLFSWLLVPLLKAGVEPLLAAKVLTYIIGAATLTAFWLLSAQFTSSKATRTVITAAFTPAVLLWASSLITPDLLLLCLLLIYLPLAFRAMTEPRIGTCVLAGLVGGVAYLAKAYALPFFVTHFSIIHITRWIFSRAPGQRRSILLNYISGITVFLAVTVSWITVLSVRYGRFTTGSAGSYSWHVVGPLVPNHPVHTQGLLEPPDPHASSVWDDPSGLTFPSWPIALSSIAYLARQLLENLLRLLGILSRGSPLAIPVVIVAVYRVLRRKGDARRRALMMGALASGALYGAGFMPLLLDSRYVWVLHALVLLLAAVVYDDVVQLNALSANRARFLLAVVALSYAASPMMAQWTHDEALRARRQAADLARQGVNVSASRLASDVRWESTLYLNFYLGAHYYGTPAPGQSAESIRRDLDRFGVDTVVVWGGLRPPYLHDFRMVAVSPHSFVLYARR
jgi:hypothetical protein